MGPGASGLKPPGRNMTPRARPLPCEHLDGLPALHADGHGGGRLDDEVDDGVRQHLLRVGLSRRQVPADDPVPADVAGHVLGRRVPVERETVQAGGGVDDAAAVLLGGFHHGREPRRRCAGRRCRVRSSAAAGSA